MPPSQPPPLPSSVSTGEGVTRVIGKVGAGTNRKIRISARLDGGELGHRRQRPPQMVRSDRLGAADRDARQRAALAGVPIEKPRLALGRDDVRDEAPAR